MKSLFYNKVIGALIASLLFFIIVIGIYLIDIHLFKVEVILYSAVGCGIIASAIIYTLLVKLSLFRCFSEFEKVLLAIVFALLSYSLAISIPTIIDRSLSIYMLETLADSPNGISKMEFSNLISREYLDKYHAVDIRLVEQLKSGTIVIDESGQIHLTDEGQKIVDFARFFKSHFLAKNRLATP